MHRICLFAALVVFATLLSIPAQSQDEARSSQLSDAQVESLVLRLAQTDGDPATDCAACIADCGRRYGRICNLLCHPYSVCSAMCAENQRECTQECRTELSCRRRIRSCQLEPDVASPPAP